MRTNQTILHLSKDPVLATLIKEIEPFEWRATGRIYEDLLNCVVSQQLSVKAAETIWNRVKQLLGENLAVETILALEDSKLREVGLSWSKVKYFKGIAQARAQGKIDQDKLTRLTDDELIAELTKLHGIGRWSVEMILIFTLNRPDVFSLGDLGLRNAVANLYGVDRDDLRRIEEISVKWSPFRSTAARYLWKSLANTTTVENKTSKSQGKDKPSYKKSK